MSRYIDADKVIQILNDSMCTFPDCYVAENIEQLPTIDIVRCKECKHNPWDFDQLDYTCVWDDDFADRPQTPDDFCSYGERKEGE